MPSQQGCSSECMSKSHHCETGGLGGRQRVLYRERSSSYALRVLLHPSSLEWQSIYRTNVATCHDDMLVVSCDPALSILRRILALAKLAYGGVCGHHSTSPCQEWLVAAQVNARLRSPSIFPANARGHPSAQTFSHTPPPYKQKPLFCSPFTLAFYVPSKPFPLQSLIVTAL